MHLPDAFCLSGVRAAGLTSGSSIVAVAVEQFGYGFGFTAYMLYMIYIARGHHETAHYAICTGFMALGMMLAGHVQRLAAGQYWLPAFLRLGDAGDDSGIYGRRRSCRWTRNLGKKLAGEV